MKNFNFMAAATGLLILSSPSVLFADDTNKPADKPGPELREKIRNMTPEDRKQWMKDHPEIAKRVEQARGNFEKNRAVLERAGLNPQQMKDVPPAQRRAKVKEVIDKRVADLEKKKSDGTGLTEQEQSDLDALNQMKTMMNRAGQRGPARQPNAQKPAASNTQ